MRNKAVLLVLALSLVACGGGAAKAEFEQYEQTLNPILEEEAALRARSDELALDVSYYGNESEFRDLIEEVLRPFYDRMAAVVAEVRPESEKLREIHAVLVRYVTLRQETYAALAELDDQVKKMAELEAPPNKRFKDVYDLMPARLTALREALATAPQIKQKLGPLFEQEANVGRGTLGALEQLRAGAISSATFLGALDMQTVPYYTKLRADVSAIEAEGAAKKAIEATLAYVDGYLEIAAAAREIAEARAKTEGVTRSLQESLQTSQMEAMETLRAYREDAKAYRDSLR